MRHVLLQPVSRLQVYGKIQVLCLRGGKKKAALELQAGGISPGPGATASVGWRALWASPGMLWS